MDSPFDGYRFGEFQVELAKRRLVGADGAVIPLSGRAYDVLVHLIEHRDRVVSKDELLKAVWPQTVVEENNLNQAISAVRRVLADTRDAPRFIATIAGRGYRFVGDVTRVVDRPAVPDVPSLASAVDATQAAGESPEGASGGRPPHSRRTILAAGAVLAAAAVGAGWWWTSTRGRPGPPRTIAVLPFKPLLAETRNPAMELGVTELLTNRLSRLPGIVVLPLSSVMRFSALDSDPLEAGRQLKVDAVVDGRVHIYEDQVRLTARLLSTADGLSLWANSYTERLGGLLAVQDSLASQLSDALRSELGEQAKSTAATFETSDVEAWQLYANGRYQIERRDAASLRRATEFFDAALKRDPRFALASAGLSDAHTLTAVFGIVPPAEAFNAARRAALRSLELAPALPYAHSALGHVVTQYDRDFATGRGHYLQALDLDPGYAKAMGQMALNLVQVGDLSGAADYIRKALSLEPATLAFNALSGWVAIFARAFDEAERELSRLVAAAPEAPLPRQFLAHVLLAKREGAKVLRLLQDRNDPAPASFSNLARAHVQTGNDSAAVAEIARLEALGAEGYGVGFDLAMIHAERGDAARALAALERGVYDHSQMQGYLNVEPALDALRDEPRFRAVSRSLALG